jgi:hypothetical protein
MKEIYKANQSAPNPGFDSWQSFSTPNMHSYNSRISLVYCSNTIRYDKYTKNPKI